MASLKVRIGADTSVLSKGVRRAKSMVGGLGKAVKAVGTAGLAAGAIAAAGAMVSLGIAVRGVNAALKVGSRLSDVAANTGLLAGQVAVLERAFKDAGLPAEKVQSTITKMQRSMVEGGEGLLTYKKAFDALGLSLDDLREQSPAEQFETIQAALANLTDPAERSARAMQIFGKSGADLGALFSNKDAMGNAAESVGAQAEILNENADAFDRSADLLAGMGDKLQGFFVGMTSFINPVLLPMLEQMNKIDLAAYGQAAGRFISTIAEAFKAGALPSLIKDGLLFAGKAMINGLWTGFKTVVVFMGTAFTEVIKTAWSKIMDVKFWQGIGQMFKTAAMWLEVAALHVKAAARPDVNYDNTIATKTGMARLAGANAWQMMGEAGDGKGLGDAVAAGMRAAGEVYRDSKPALDNRAELERMTATMQRLAVVVDEKTEEDKKANKKPRAGGLTVPGIAKAAARVVAPRVQSMVKFGGAASAVRRVSLAEERNGILKDIRKNTRGKMVARFA